MSGYATIDEVTLEWIKVAASNAVTAEFAESVRPEIYRREVWGALVHTLTAQVLAERLPSGTVTAENTFTFEVPASPWQQFKADHDNSWWLRWLTKWRPPVHRVHQCEGRLVADVTRYWAYPEARVQREMGRAIRVALISQDTNWWTDEVQP